MSDWQPIETARKDSKAILVWCPENKCQYMVTWNDDWFIFGCFTRLTRNVTHWRELPSYPDEPQPEPLRWVENCKPDKPGIWACRCDDGSVVVSEWSESDIVAAELLLTRCYLGPIPEILPPKKKVVQRLWIDYCEPNDGKVLCAWFADGETIQPPGNWIRTDETREVEQ